MPECQGYLPRLLSQFSTEYLHADLHQPRIVSLLGSLLISAQRRTTRTLARLHAVQAGAVQAAVWVDAQDIVLVFVLAHAQGSQGNRVVVQVDDLVGNVGD